MKITRPVRSNSYSLQIMRRNRLLFGEYLKGKYDYISKLDMLKNEKEVRQYYKLTVALAIGVWKEIYEYLPQSNQNNHPGHPAPIPQA